MGGLFAGVVAAINSFRQGRSAARKDDLDAMRVIIDAQAKAHSVARETWIIERADFDARLTTQAMRHAADRETWERERAKWHAERAEFSARLDAQAVQHSIDRVQWHTERAELKKRISGLENKGDVENE